MKVDEEQNPSGQAVISPLNALSERELDAAVAERVMGHVVGRLKPDRKQNSPDYSAFRNNRTGALMSGLMYHAGMMVVDKSILPKYSAEYAAAMRVVEKLIEKHYSVRIEKDDDEGSLWDVAFDLWDYSGERGRPVAYGGDMDASLPLAICRAALAAVADAETEREAES